ncbi:hybrid sensor histidine kinase/response regulator [Piscinibacter defluvii]|uniref:hybrid sensor histidine kinase/response regulator n=1 Tax=Piscinibacter defluvii TaxID=1796922 RepID=UPI00197BE209|nr:ATP-binding protein [Piscinibacter defluvii]
MTGYFSRTLTGKVVLWLAGLGAAALLLFGALGAWVLYRQIETQELERLALQAAERARVAEQVLARVTEMHLTVRDEFARRWPDLQDAASARRFDTLLERDAAGAWRSRREIADGRQYPTGWVRQGTPLSDDLRRRVVLFHDLSTRYGPGAATRNDNLYFVSVPEQANLGYDPFLAPTWSTDVASDYDQLSEDWGRVANLPPGPDLATRWSTPEFDAVSPGMGAVFAALTPIRIDGRHLASIGTTVVVKEFLARVLPPAGPEIRYLALLPDGRMLDTADAKQPERGRGSPYAALLHDGAPAYQGRDATDGSLYALARIEGPGWYVAALLPVDVVRARAAAPLLWALTIGAVALLLPLVIVAAILRRQVARPLGALTRAAETLARGDTAVRLPAEREDELGRLAAAFNHMAHEVAERDAALREDKRRIEQALADTTRAEAELARQREALHQSEKLSALGSLLAGVAHELNNPLTVVVGRAMQLEEQAASATDRERAQAIRSAAERCTRIVRTFLAMARRQDAVRSATDLNAVLRGALELLGYQLHSGAVLVRTQLDPALPRVLADADQLSQVFLNLLMNAQQAMAGQPGERRLRVRSRRHGGQVRMEVEDNGPGVPAELAGRIFDPFFTTKPVGEGTGVGLAVSLGIVQSHGGTLALETPDGGGARFVVTLPVLGAEETPAPLAGPAPADGAPGAPRRILVVDDEPEIGALLRELLESAGHMVMLAASGQEALERLSTQAFDVVLTDLKMPGMDGPTLYREIARRDPALAQRVIAMTGDALGGGVQAFVQQHGLPLLHKPFDAPEVLAQVRRAGGAGRA